MGVVKCYMQVGRHVHALYRHPWYVCILIFVLLGYQGVDVKWCVEYVWRARCVVLNYMMLGVGAKEDVIVGILEWLVLTPICSTC